MTDIEKIMDNNQTGSENKTTSQKNKSSRLVSLDTMRGFTMLWITGGGYLISSLQSLGDFKLFNFLAYQMDHSSWEGLRFYDCIWPGFMLMVGVSIPFAYAKRSLTQSYPLMLRHALIRFFILFLLGSLRESVSMGEVHLFELSSALQPIAVAYLVSFLLVRKSWKIQAGVGLAILLFYGLAQALIPVPGVGAGSYEHNANLVWFLDGKLLPSRIEDSVFLAGWGTTITMIPPISTTILGLLIGRLLRSEKGHEYKLKILAAISAGVLASGYLVSFFVPVVMKLWTVSYGLLSAGWAAFELLLLYLIIDVLGYRKWSLFFVVIGMNALAIYLSGTVMKLHKIADIFTQGPASLMGSFGPVFSALGFLALEWSILYWMYKRKIFLNP
ncbi:MAG: hypothetical protein KAS71_16875 [Bacteroidales bacterium]|nr:hypothetical protein [Bacteroidales bacterium]